MATNSTEKGDIVKVQLDNTGNNATAGANQGAPQQYAPQQVQQPYAQQYQQPYNQYPQGMPPVQQQPKKKRKWPWIILGIVVALIVLGAIGAAGNKSDDKGSSQQETTPAASQNAEQPPEQKTEQPAEKPVEQPAAPAELSFGSTFDFDNLTIHIGDGYTTTTLDNPYADHANATVIVLPISITNNAQEAQGLNMFSVKEFGPAGTEMDTVYTYFMDSDIRMMGDARQGATLNGNLYFLYEGDGDYYISFKLLGGKATEVKIPVRLQQ